ncbi:MAG: hypothetical protein IRY85_22160, partial [Micromonosporaceae bacterium]|nr:hypothetical protein [Micromonosporaceae bacterium]
MSADERQHRLTRRGLLQAGAAVGAAAAAGVVASGSAAAAPGANPPGQASGERLVLRKGRIHTMDGRGTVVDSVAIENSRFVEVGRNVPPKGSRGIDLG